MTTQLPFSQEKNKEGNKNCATFCIMSKKTQFSFVGWFTLDIAQEHTVGSCAIHMWFNAVSFEPINFEWAKMALHRTKNSTCITIGNALPTDHMVLLYF